MSHGPRTTEMWEIVSSLTLMSVNTFILQGALGEGMMVGGGHQRRLFQVGETQERWQRKGVDSASKRCVCVCVYVCTPVYISCLNSYSWFVSFLMIPASRSNLRAGRNTETPSSGLITEFEKPRVSRNVGFLFKVY